MKSSERRDISDEGLAYRALIDDVLALLQSPDGLLHEEDIARSRQLVEAGVERFQDDEAKSHGLKQILTVFGLVKGKMEWAETRRMVLEVVRGQRD